MSVTNWASEVFTKDYHKIAKKLVEDRYKWEVEQVKQGRKEVRVPHPELPNTFIVKYV